MTVLEALKDEEFIFSISLTNKYLQDLSQEKPRIGVYDSGKNSLRVMQLEPTEEEDYFGKFMTVFEVSGVNLLPSDRFQESSSDQNYVYLARGTKIYRVHLSPEGLEFNHFA